MMKRLLGVAKYDERMRQTALSAIVDEIAASDGSALAEAMLKEQIERIKGR